MTAGRQVPNQVGIRQSGEGIVIVLSGVAVDAWKLGGSCWKAWNSRLVTASLKFGHQRLHVLSYYASTFAASREEKDAFFNFLQ